MAFVHPGLPKRLKKVHSNTVTYTCVPCNVLHTLSTLFTWVQNVVMNERAEKHGAAGGQLHYRKNNSQSTDLFLYAGSEAKRTDGHYNTNYAWISRVPSSNLASAQLVDSFPPLLLSCKIVWNQAGGVTRILTKKKPLCTNGFQPEIYLPFEMKWT